VDSSSTPLFLDVNADRTVPGPATVPARNLLDEWLGVMSVCAQVVLVGLIMSVASIETLGFRRVVYIAAVGFVVNHVLPSRYRLPFFVALSLFSMAVALGGSPTARIADRSLGLARAGSIVGIGVVLIAICRLPIGFWKRGALLALVGAIVAGFRAGAWDSRVLAVVWPVLAALFMFRIIAYLYDASTSKQRPTWAQSLAYFFLIPNFCALLFPVIDFRTFCQTYYNERDLAIYQRGVKWMTRGIIQLLLYRLVYQLFAVDAANVHDGSELIQFVVTNVFLYLNVSGSFHLFIGLLLLFGFNLPETNHRYFLASSFTDYWRRVNTYWRAFIMKVFYYPAYFRLKNRGQVTALVGATLWSFAITWFLHLYQTWWLKGEVSWTWNDGLFWTSLALLVLANSLWELRHNRRRKLTKGGYTLREAASITVKTAVTFSVITLLWSLWSTPTLKLWFHIWSLADLHTLFWAAAAVGCIMAATVLFEVLPEATKRPVVENGRHDYPRWAAFRWNAFQSAVPLLVTLLVTYYSSSSRLDTGGIQNFPVATVLVQTLTNEKAEGQGRGYYENLTSDDKGSSQFWETMTGRYNARFALSNFTFENEMNVQELKPNVHLKVGGMLIETNRWGMRDRDRNPLKPADTLRLAILGSSHVMGYGLPADEMFEPMLEDQLNNSPAGDTRFEVLNFAVSAQSPLGQIWMLKNRALNFHPNIVLFVAHLNDFEWATHDAERDLHNGIALPLALPPNVFSKVGVTNRTIEPFAVRRLRPQQAQILSYCYQEIVRECQTANVLPVCVFLPVPADLPLDKAKAAKLLQTASDAGFITVDLSDIYAGYDPGKLMLHDIGQHSNAKAHALIADALYGRLTADPRIKLLDRAQRMGARSTAGSVGRNASE
jgi:D-alanyl-lipoteichoic acid acyltransferase DltB (MBOAT superfamily)